MSNFITASVGVLVVYEDYMNGCFLLGRSQEGTSFIRSVFDFGVRQRRAVKGYVTYDVALVLEFYELREFQTLWVDLDEGANSFTYSGMIHGDTSAKEVRFVSPYTVEELGGGLYRVGSVLEVVKSGDSLYACPLVPSNMVIAQDGVMPC